MDMVLPTEVTQQTEEAIDPIAAKQSLRTALGATLDLDVGVPNEMVQLVGTAAPVQARDALGLLLDPVLYAKKGCKHCEGRGVVFHIQHVPVAVALKLIKENPANEALLQQKEPGKYYSRSAVKCGCVQSRYVKQYIAFAKALVAAGLAKENAVQKRYELV